MALCEAAWLLGPGGRAPRRRPAGRSPDRRGAGHGRGRPAGGPCPPAHQAVGATLAEQVVGALLPEQAVASCAPADEVVSRSRPGPRHCRPGPRSHRGAECRAGRRGGRCRRSWPAGRRSERKRWAARRSPAEGGCAGAGGGPRTSRRKTLKNGVEVLGREVVGVRDKGHVAPVGRDRRAVGVVCRRRRPPAPAARLTRVVVPAWRSRTKMSGRASRVVPATRFLPARREGHWRLRRDHG